MGLLDILSNFRDIFEIGRKTSSDAKNNKPKERNYNFSDGENIPTTRGQYNKSKKVNSSQNTTKKNLLFFVVANIEKEVLF